MLLVLQTNNRTGVFDRKVIYDKADIKYLMTPVAMSSAGYNTVGDK